MIGARRVIRVHPLGDPFGAAPCEQSIDQPVADVGYVVIGESKVAPVVRIIRKLTIARNGFPDELACASGPRTRCQHAQAVCDSLYLLNLTRSSRRRLIMLEPWVRYSSVCAMLPLGSRFIMLFVRIRPASRAPRFLSARRSAAASAWSSGSPSAHRSADMSRDNDHSHESPRSGRRTESAVYPASPRSRLPDPGNEW
jgi:hypothetical protein